MADTVRPKSESTKLFKKFGTDIGRLIRIVAMSLFALGVIVAILINLGDVKAFFAGESEQLSPEESAIQQQAEYEAALRSHKWFLCDDSGDTTCVDRGARIISFDPLKFEFTFGATRLVSSFIGDGCPNIWTDDSGESGEFCLEERTDELYVGWIERNGYYNGLCLAFGRDSRHRKFRSAPFDCIAYFNALERGEEVLSVAHH